MRSAIGLAVLTAGAILTFAVSAEVPGINLRLTGVIVMLAGIAGMISPARAAAWLHLHPLPHARPRPEQPGPHEDDDDFGYSAYLLQDPAVLAAEVLRGAGVGQPAPGHGPRGPRGSAEQAANGTAGHDGHDGYHGQG
jgi:hypothetical protein